VNIPSQPIKAMAYEAKQALAAGVKNIGTNPLDCQCGKLNSLGTTSNLEELKAIAKRKMDQLA
jgi:hypothetical protein